jgi:mRNA-degrading endonuclease RelE of RelBE toxin-antitoxin system
MDKIAKALLALSLKEREIIKDILLGIRGNSLAGFDLKKLKGAEDIFRIRKGKIRIIFKKNSDGEISILAIERRSDKTYSKF